MIGWWDVTLIVAVTAQAAVLAYVFDPRWKAFVLLIPIPFTIAALAVGRPLDAANVWGLVLLYLFTHGVRLLHYGLRVPIIPAIVASALGYCGLGVAMVRLLPKGEWFFWFSILLVAGMAYLAWVMFPSQRENGDRTTLPPWIKLPAIAAVVFVLVLAKGWLQGFVTVFPMVGVIGAYEGRKCLGTICRAIPSAIFGLLLMIVTVHLSQERFGLGIALVLGWAVFLSVLGPLSKKLLFGANVDDASSACRDTVTPIFVNKERLPTSPFLSDTRKGVTRK